MMPRHVNILTISIQNFLKSLEIIHGLSTNGFNPHDNKATPYSCWPIFVIAYNLPTSMCMEREYIFLTLVIPGPRSLSKSLHMYLRPLIDELKVLWDSGINTFDASKKRNFNMKVSLLCTISDFPAYEMLSGWSTYGKLTCPHCIKITKSFVLDHSKNCCKFDCHC
jgi:hypothetical protein